MWFARVFFSKHCFSMQFVKNTYLTVGSIALACGSCALPGCFWFQAMFFNSVFLEIVGGVLVIRSPEQLRKRMMRLAGACFQAMFFNSVSKETFDWYLLVGFYCLEQQYTARTTFSIFVKLFGYLELDTFLDFHKRIWEICGSLVSFGFKSSKKCTYDNITEQG